MEQWCIDLPYFLCSETFWVASGSIGSFLVALLTWKSLRQYSARERKIEMREVIEKVIRPLLNGSGVVITNGVSGEGVLNILEMFNSFQGYPSPSSNFVWKSLKENELYTVRLVHDDLVVSINNFESLFTEWIKEERTVRSGLHEIFCKSCTTFGIESDLSPEQLWNRCNFLAPNSFRPVYFFTALLKGVSLLQLINSPGNRISNDTMVKMLNQDFSIGKLEELLNEFKLNLMGNTTLKDFLVKTKAVQACGRGLQTQLENFLLTVVQ